MKECLLLDLPFSSLSFALSSALAMEKEQPNFSYQLFLDLKEDTRVCVPHPGLKNQPWESDVVVSIENTAGQNLPV